MAYTNLFRKLAEAWGIKTEANTEYGALEAIAENPPFGVKTEMVEIVPEQSVTGENQNGIYGVIRREGVEGNTFVLSKGKKYIIVLNGKTYESESSTFNFGNNTDEIIIGDKDISDLSLDNPNMPFSISSGEMNTGGVANQIMWRAELGETITLAIYEEQAVYTPIAQEFIPNIAYFKDAEYDNACMGIAPADALPINLSCLNMTFEQAVQHIMSGKPLMGVVQYVNGGPAISMVREMQMATNMDGQLAIIMYISKGWDSTAVFIWTANGIEEEA